MLLWIDAPQKGALLASQYCDLRVERKANVGGKLLLGSSHLSSYSNVEEYHRVAGIWRLDGHCGTL